MDGAKRNELQEALEQLLETSKDIEAAAVVSMDGFPMASIIPEGYESERLGAMSAALLSLGERTANELKRGELAQVFVEGSQGYVFVLAAGEDTVLTAVVKRGGKLGMVLYDIRKTAKRVAGIAGSHLQAEVE
ncbi:MAG: roadblock/LC7 domain-containing protein [Actinobacteria bacterium]|nr:roadblock/LC7 domain-containing protein [Actinomycetota bacterium]